MTHEQETTIRFIQDTAKAAGFGTRYHLDIENGIKSGSKEIELKPAWKEYDQNTTMLWQPKLVEQEKYPGRYNFGYEATLVKANADPVTQYFTNFKLTGPMLEQSKNLLEGGTVAVSDWDNKKNERREVLMSIDLSKIPKAGENHPVIRIPMADLRIGTLISKEDIVATPVEKDRHLRELQSGQPVEVTLRRFVNNVSDFYPATLQFNIVNDDKGLRLAMQVKDPDGKVLRTPSIEPKQSSTETLGMVVAMQNEKMPENLLKLLQKGQTQTGETAQKTAAMKKAGPARA